jgi:pimeloyl-ACP methyl ester carboxylesterase
MTILETQTVTTARGITGDVQRRGTSSAAAPIVFLHGASGLFDHEPLLDALAVTHTAFSPVWPGFGVHEDEHKIEDMLDFALHGADIIRALMISDAKPILVGHDMGAMIAAEMACLSPDSYRALVLISPLGLWDDAYPIPDIFTKLPFEFPELLFADHELGTSLLAKGLNFEDPQAIENFQVRNARQLGVAGKILFPIPNRRLSKRLYRCTTPALAIWGEQDQLTSPKPYAGRWSDALGGSEVTISNAGHMVHLEQPGEVSAAIQTFLTGL